MQFKGKVDWWAALAILGSPAVTLAVAIHLQITAFYFIFAAQAAFYLGCCWPQWYRLEEGDLVIQSGLVRRRIAFEAIRSVRPTRDSTSAMALSLDRIEIQHESGCVLIAVDDRNAFISALVLRSPQLLSAAPFSYKAADYLGI